MGQTRNRILGTLRLQRLAARQARAAALDLLLLRRDERTPCLVPVRVERSRRS